MLWKAVEATRTAAEEFRLSGCLFPLHNSWGHFSLKMNPDFSASDWLRNFRLKHPTQLYGRFGCFSLKFSAAEEGPTRETESPARKL